MTRGLLRRLPQHGGFQHVPIARGSMCSGIFAPQASSICLGRLQSSAKETLASGRSETEAEFWALRESLAIPVDRWATWPEYTLASSVVHGKTNRDLVEQPMGNSAAPACSVPHQRQPPKVICNSPSVFSHAEFVSSYIRDLCLSGAVEEAPLASLVIPQLFQSECFMFTFDLKDGYHHISVAEAHRKYLDFSWPLDGTVRYFRFAALPFGLKPAPGVFTKVLRPLVAHWRRKGLRILMFLDDGTGAASSLVAARQMVDIVRADLTCAGWLVNETLGHMVDSTENWIHFSPTRVDRLLAILERLNGSSEQIPVRYLARLAESLVSMWMALGSISRLQTRSLHALVADVSAESWDAYASITPLVKAEISFWRQHFQSFHGQPIWPCKLLIMSLTWSDSSDTGWGGFCLHDGVAVARGKWPFHSSARTSRSTLRELLAIRYTLVSLRTHIAQRQICINTDNQNVVRILCNGSGKVELQEPAVAIFLFYTTIKACLFCAVGPEGPQCYSGLLVENH